MIHNERKGRLLLLKYLKNIAPAQEFYLVLELSYPVRIRTKIKIKQQNQFRKLLTKLLTRTIHLLCFLAFFTSVLPHSLQAQDTVRQTSNKPVILPASAEGDTIIHFSTDSIFSKADSLSGKGKPGSAKKKDALKSKVDYSAQDSLRFDVKNRKVYLYRKADIKYTDVNLKGGYVEINFPEKQVHATGCPDTTGKMSEYPEFTQGTLKFKVKVIDYNYETKKGYIQTVFTKQDEGYLHGRVVKKMENDVTYIRDGAYTTCEIEDNPHYEFRFNKAKVIPDKEVITGPAYMVVANSPTPLLIPFGLFPNRTKRRSGIIVPTYGESANRGFFLENGGYYWAMNQYMDLQLIGDIYSRGSWAIKPVFRYNNRYHYNGELRLGYALNRLGASDSPDYEQTKDYEFRWVHAQDPKARPHSSFSANVNIVSSTFNKYNPVNTQNYLSNTFQSSVNYATNFRNTYYLTLNFSHSQNTLQKTIDFNFPQVSFSINQFYPFRPKKHVGKAKWFENISMKYNMDAQNQYNATDSTLFKEGWQKDMRNGIHHSYPISGTFRVLKYFNWTNSIITTDVMYFNSIRKEYLRPYFNGVDTVPGHDSTYTVYEFRNAFWFSVTSILNTRLYGMFQFKKGPLIAVRHMFLPSVSFSYTPDYIAPWLGYYKTVTNDPDSINPQRYSVFEQGIYGGPPMLRSGIVTFGIDNNLELKVRNRKDTVTGTRKIVLLDNFRIAESYDLAKDSLNWSKLTISARTTLIKNLTVNYNSLWDPYAINDKGQNYNKSEMDVNGRILRLINTAWTIGFSYSLSSDKLKGGKKTAKKGTQEQKKDLENYYDYYVDFDIPWSFSFTYNFNFTKNFNASQMRRVPNLTQTLNFNGMLNITPKWKIDLMTGWDFVNGQLAYTSINVYRDLHCWQMRFGWIPKGAQKSWNFSINVKASILQDLKLNKKKDFRDYGP